MAGYLDTRQMIIDTLMGRPEGTQIQPEDHQAYALNLLNYVRSVELSSGSTLTGIAEADTVPIEPYDSRVAYITSVPQNTVRTFTYFKKENNEPITITTTNSSVFVILLWNTQYWEYQPLPVTVFENNSFVGYFECASLSTDANKTISSEINQLTTNMRILVKMNNINTQDNATLQIGLTQSKPLFYNGSRASLTNSWAQGEVLDIYYTGTIFISCTYGGAQFSTGEKVSDVSIVNIPGTNSKFVMSQKGATDLVSEYNISANNNNAEYTFAQAVALVPASLQKGGLTIKYIDSTTHEYTIKRLMSSTWNTTESNWQGIDTKPTANSSNLVKSGGAYDSIQSKITEDFLIGKNLVSKNLFNKNDRDLQKNKYLDTSNVWQSYVGVGESGYIPVLENKIYKWTTFGDVVGTSWPYLVVCFYDCNKEFIGSITNPSTLGYVVTPTNARYMRLAFPLSAIDILVISFNENVNSYIPYISPVQDNPLLNPSVGLYLPHNQVDFWDIVDYEKGIINSEGVLLNYPYNTLKYDISKYVGKTIVIYISHTANSYDMQFPMFIIIKDDDSIVDYHDSNLPRTEYAPIVTSYTVQEHDKWLKLSVGEGSVNPIKGYAALMLKVDLNSPKQKQVIIPPVLKPSASEVETELIQYCVYSNPQMFNQNAEGIAENKYINGISEGEVTWANFNGVNESDYIQVTPGTNVYKTDFDAEGNIVGTNWGYLYVCLFNENKEPIGVVKNPSTLGYLPIPNNISYIRFSYLSSKKTVISEGANVNQYYEYFKPGYSIKDRIEDVNRNLQEQINENKGDIENINQRIADITGDGSQWINKIWYAYGTSITSTVLGKYVPYLAEMSQMTVVNKGISGGGIGDLGGYSHGQVRAAIMNTTDGKLSADLITLEVGANDTGADVPLGTIYDTDETTLCGCLNMCIRYLQQNTNAQIVVMPSPATTTLPAAENKYYEAMWLFKKICFINKCWWIDGMTNLGTAKISRTDIRYVQDNIHQTELGGYVFAKAIWAELKKIPTFDIALPN